MKLLIAPHSADETLWTSFTIMRERPMVLIVCDAADPAMAARLRSETLDALAILLGEDAREPIVFLEFSEACVQVCGYHIQQALQLIGRDAEHVFAPAVEDGGNGHHNLIGEIARRTFPNRLTPYLSYTQRGKSTTGRRVAIEQPAWLARKLRALSCYESQMEHSSTQPHFLRSQDEYYAC